MIESHFHKCPPHKKITYQHKLEKTFTCSTGKQSSPSPDTSMISTSKGLLLTVIVCLYNKSATRNKSRRQFTSKHTENGRDLITAVFSKSFGTRNTRNVVAKRPRPFVRACPRNSRSEASFYINFDPSCVLFA